MFKRLTKADVDRTLSELMHAARHELKAESGRIQSQAAARNVLHGSATVSLIGSAADKIHKAALEKAVARLIEFVPRMQIASSQIVQLARPHLENLGNSLLGLIPDHLSPDNRQQLRAQQTAVFQQRLESALRDVQIGRFAEAGFIQDTRSEKEWLSAQAALRRVSPTMGETLAQRAICQRAHDGMIKAKADRFMRDQQAVDDADIPREFWWAGGEPALTQNWIIGDFDTWIRDRHYRAYGVKFLTADIEKMIPTDGDRKATLPSRTRSQNWRSAFTPAGDRPLSQPPFIQGLSDSEAVEAIAAWFFENFEDPAERTPYETAEGGYQWIWGGPWDTREIIEGSFDAEVLDQDLIQAAVDRIGDQDWTVSSSRTQHDEDEEEPPSSNEVQSVEEVYSEVRERLLKLKDVLAEIEAPPGIGHNNPPEDLDAEPLNSEDRQELKEAISVLENQPPEPSDVREAQRALQKIQQKESKVAAWFKSRGDTFTEEFVKELGKESAKAVGEAVRWGVRIAYIALFGHMTGATTVIENWLRLIVF